MAKGKTNVEIYEDDGRMGYKHSPRCLICNAKDPAGKSLRYEIDTFAVNSSFQEIRDTYAVMGLRLTDKILHNHLHRHAPYVLEARKNVPKKVQKFIVKVSQTKMEVGEALQDILDRGAQMVKDGNLPITERLYIEAIKEQGRRGTRTTLDAEFETMDQDFISKISGRKEKEIEDGK
jgi:hypothetical protein